MKFTLLVVLALAVCVNCATPSPPKWPPAFSASVIVDRTTAERPTIEYFRWFYDLANSRERFDGIFRYLNLEYFRSLIIDYKKGTEYNILTRGSFLECYNRKPVGKLIQPNFTNFTYAGFALLNYQVTNHWRAINKSGELFEYYDTTDDREPVEFDYINFESGELETWKFYEFDAEAQDPDLWVIPEPVELACNPEEGILRNAIKQQ